MSLLTPLGGILQQQGTGAAFDPLGDISWFDAWWAEDPAWTPPADAGNVSSLNGNGTDGTNWTVTATTSRTRYFDSVASLNSQPGIQYAGDGSSTGTHYPKATFGSTLTEPYSVVVIGFQTSVTTEYLTDGITSTATNRAIISDNGSGVYRFYQGTNVVSTVSTDTSAHLFVGVSSNTGANKIYVDGTVDTATVAAGSLTGSTCGASYNGTNYLAAGAESFVGYYSGDITANGSWAGFESWASSHYSITIS